MGAESSLTRRTIFLDTNALISLASYLLIAKQQSLPPYAVTTSYDQLRRQIRNVIPKEIADYYLRGAKTLALLQEETQGATSDPDIYASRMSRAEMISGRIESAAHAKMVQQGIPYRSRQSVKDRTSLVRHFLDALDYQTVIGDIDQLSEELRTTANIGIVFLEDEGRLLREAFGLAEFLLGRTFMDVLDCWIYCGAVISQAETFICFDDNLRGAVNKLKNPQTDQDWNRLRNEFLKLISQLIPGGENFTLPVAGQPPNQVPKPFQ